MEQRLLEMLDVFDFFFLVLACARAQPQGTPQRHTTDGPTSAAGSDTDSGLIVLEDIPQHPETSRVKGLKGARENKPGRAPEPPWT